MKLNNKCKLEKNDVEDEYLLSFENNIIIINESAGIILDYISNQSASRHDLFLYLKGIYDITEENMIEVDNIINEFKTKNIIIED